MTTVPKITREVLESYLHCKSKGLLKLASLYAVENMHDGSAKLTQSVLVRETFEGKPVWEDVVHVFDLAGHRTATRAYAWSSPIEGSAKRRFFATLHSEQINSPRPLPQPRSVAGP